MSGLFLCRVRFLPFSVVYCLIALGPLFAQDSTSGPVALYEKKLAGSQQLFNGTEYKMHRSRSGEHPFFLSDKYIVGSLNYDGVRYEAVPMYFDIAKDQLVTPYYYDGTWMAFISQLVTEFELQGHRLRYFREGFDGLSAPGFLEVLYEGKLKLYVKHSKTYQEQIDGTQIIFQFKVAGDYYLVREGRAQRWNEGERIPSLLKDKQSELRAFLRKNPRAEMVDLVRYCDSLIK